MAACSTFLLLALLVVKALAQQLSFPQLINVTVVDSDGTNQCPSVQTELNNIRQQVLDIVSACGGPGWQRVAYIDMTDPTHMCPAGLQLTTFSKRTCGRLDNRQLCSPSVIIDVQGTSYSQVCGRMRAYQVGATSGFWPYRRGVGFDDAYATGILLSHGPSGSREHIWSFVVGSSESGGDRTQSCPCDTTDSSVVSPPFVGSDYYCESGSQQAPGYNQFYDDPLWDGEGCSATSTCCDSNVQPWFMKMLAGQTSDDIELRLCPRSGFTEANIAVELIELYIK